LLFATWPPTYSTIVLTFRRGTFMPWYSILHIPLLYITVKTYC
jgi:hypothetical protein